MNWVEQYKGPALLAAGIIVALYLIHLAQEDVFADAVENRMNEGDVDTDETTDTKEEDATERECSASPCGKHSTERERTFTHPTTGVTSYLCDYCGLPVGSYLLPKCG